MDGTNEPGREPDQHFVVPVRCSVCHEWEWRIFIEPKTTKIVFRCTTCPATIMTEDSLKRGQLRGQDAGGFSAN